MGSLSDFPMHAFIALLGLAGSVLVIFGSGYTPFLVALVALSTIVAAGLNILVGLSGQISIGHVGFYAIGAYAFGILAASGVNYWLAWPLSALLTGVVGALLAIPALRVSGPYLAMMTIAFAFVTEHAIIETEPFTGGQNGLMNIMQPTLTSGLAGERAVALLAVIAATAALIAYHWLQHAPLGKAMVAVRDSEVAAQAIGTNPVLLKTLAFALSAAFAGLAGALFGSLLTFVAPSSFPLSQSILFLFAVIVGGAGYTLGPLCGSIVVVLIPELISWMAEYRLLCFGTLLLIVLWIAPEGVLGSLSKLLRRASGDAPRADDRLIGHFLARISRAALAVDKLSIAFGGVQAADGVSFVAAPGSIMALIGPNGAGKTTVLNMISGFYAPDSGTVRIGTLNLAGRPAHRVAAAGLARTYQTTQLFESLSVADNIHTALRNCPRSDMPEAVAETDDRIGEALLAFVGYKGGTQVLAGDLPHVDRRLVEMARALALRPRVLLLDEPAAGLMQADKIALRDVLKRIAGTGITVVLVEHDMDLVMAVSDQVIVLDAGRTISDGKPDEVRADARVRAAYLGTGSIPQHPRDPSVSELGDVVLDVNRLSAGYGGVPVLHDISLSVRKGETVALLGANGAGKSTLMKCLSGLLRPVSGSIFLHGRDIAKLPANAIAGIRLALVPEGRRVFPELSVRDNLMLGAFSTGGDECVADLRAVLELFPRLEERLHQRAGLLSGGEQQMLAIGRAMMARPEVLLLDEPSLGLAPTIIDEVFRIIASLRDHGTTILLVDQMAMHALATCDRAYIMESGRIVREGSALNLRSDSSIENSYFGQSTKSASG